MGIVKAIAKAIGGGLSDQWLDIIEAGKMDDTTVLSVGRKAGETDGKDSGRGNDDIISDGSLIHVEPNMFMILTDGGRVVDYTAEEGYYKVSMDTEPSLFNGDFGDALRETFERIKYSGTAPGKQPGSPVPPLPDATLPRWLRRFPSHCPGAAWARPRLHASILPWDQPPYVVKS